VLLERHAKTWKGALVLPTDDAAIASLSLYHERLAGWFRLAIPPLDCVPYLLDRTKMLKAAADVGIQLPTCHGLLTDVATKSAVLQYPAVVKPLRSGEFSAKFDRKLFLLRGLSDLRRCADQLATAEVGGHVFDLVPGPDSDIYAYCVYIDQRGQPQAGCTVRKLRQSPPRFGVARVAEITETIPLLREQSIELLRHIGFRGFAATEFKYDRRDGSFRFFEVNGRSVIYNSLLRQANLDVAKLTLTDHAQGLARQVESRQWPGVWIHLHADILRSVRNWRQEGLKSKDYLEPYRRQKTFAVWSSDDVMPFGSQWTRTLGQACSAVFRKPGNPENKW
jgi:predicted ATP-grasp superfamily ATP-dependent carboligase